MFGAADSCSPGSTLPSQEMQNDQMVEKEQLPQIPYLTSSQGLGFLRLAVSRINYWSLIGASQLQVTEGDMTSLSPHLLPEVPQASTSALAWTSVFSSVPIPQGSVAAFPNHPQEE